MKEERVTGEKKVHGNRWEEGARCRLIIEECQVRETEGKKEEGNGGI